MDVTTANRIVGREVLPGHAILLVGSYRTDAGSMWLMEKGGECTVYLLSGPRPLIPTIIIPATRQDTRLISPEDFICILQLEQVANAHPYVASHTP